MLFQVLLTRKAVARAAVTIGIWAHQRLLSARVLLVDFALMTEKSARVGKPLDFVAPGLHTLVRPVMLIHMFTITLSAVSPASYPMKYSLPFAWTPEGRRRGLAIGMIAIDLTGSIFWRISCSSHREPWARWFG